MVWEFTTNIDPADRYVNTFDVVNITNGAVDNSWTAQDLDDLHAGLMLLVTAVRAQMSQGMRIKEIRYYQMYFNPIIPVDERPPDWKDDPYGHSGPPVRVTAINGAGDVAGFSLPPQVAVSVTEKTAYPRHWGRTYLPPLHVNAVAASGYISAQVVANIADGVSNMFASLHQDELYPVVPVVQVDKEPFRGLLTVNEIQVDNVFDVIRRRRSATTTQRVTRP